MANMSEDKSVPELVQRDVPNLENLSLEPILPNEILIHIIESTTDPGTLFNLCLTSKWFHEFAEPCLYRSYKSPQPFRVKNFLATLYDRPDLAARVRALYLGPWKLKGKPPGPDVDSDSEDEDEENEDGEEDEEEEDKSDPEPEDHSFEGKLIDKELGACYWTPTHFYGNGIQDAHVSLLLYYAHSIEHLELVLPPTRYGWVFLNLIMTAGNRLPPRDPTSWKSLKQLRSLCLKSAEGRPFNLRLVSSFFLPLPNLESIELHGVVQNDSRLSPREMPNKGSKISSLILRNSIVDNRAFPVLLKTVVALRTCIVENTRNDLDPLRSSSFDFETATTALLEHSSSLEILRLIFLHSDGPIQLVNTLGQLADMEKLHTLDIPLRALPDCSVPVSDSLSDTRLENVLPRTLKDLTVRTTDWSLAVGVMAALFSLCHDQHLDKLERVVFLGLDVDLDEIIPPQIKHWNAEFEKRNVVLKVEKQ